ncbi:MAG: hypothetical protein K6F35_01550 [Lachnospiraceae bacterium]|nr:hypothetical protein [Lachnospiraceae bacterium]
MKNRMAKKLVWAVTACMVLTAGTVPAMANPLGGAAAAAAEAIKSGYEESVVQRMIGRAGAKTANGAKGIAHEILYADKLNLKDIFKKGTKTSLTKSSTARQVDVITTNSGKVAARYQLKDTAGSITKTLKQVKSGKYQQVQMVGTKETARAFNERALAEGVTKTMKDSGISTKTTSRIADKALNPVPGAAEIAGAAGKAAGIGAVVSGAVAAAESAINGDDISEATGHIAVGTASGAISTGVGAAAGGAVAAGLASAGVVGAAPVVVPAVAVVGVSIGTGVVLDKANEKFDIEGKISQTIDDADEKYGMGKKAEAAKDNAVQAVEAGVTKISEKINGGRQADY